MKSACFVCTSKILLKSVGKLTAKLDISSVTGLLQRTQAEMCNVALRF